MNVKLTLKGIKGMRRLDITDPFTIECDGMYIGKHSDCDTLKLGSFLTKEEKSLIKSSDTLIVETDETMREIIEYWTNGTIFDLKKVM